MHVCMQVIGWCAACRQLLFRLSDVHAGFVRGVRDIQPAISTTAQQDIHPQRLLTTVGYPLKLVPTLAFILSHTIAVRSHLVNRLLLTAGTGRRSCFSRLSVSSFASTMSSCNPTAGAMAPSCGVPNFTGECIVHCYHDHDRSSVAA